MGAQTDPEQEGMTKVAGFPESLVDSLLLSSSSPRLSSAAPRRRSRQEPTEGSLLKACTQARRKDAKLGDDEDKHEDDDDNEEEEGTLREPMDPARLEACLASIESRLDTLLQKLTERRAPPQVGGGMLDKGSRIP